MDRGTGEFHTHVPKTMAVRSNDESIKIGDKVTVTYRVKGNKVKNTTGIVSEVSVKGYVRLHTCKRRSMVVQKYRRGEKPADYKEKTFKKKKNTDTALLKVGVKVTIKTGKTEEGTGIVY